MITQHQIKQAAAAFVKESSVDALADILMMTPRSVRRFVKSDAFQAELDALNYDGPRDFTGRKRGRARKYHHARDLWESIRASTPRHKQSQIISQVIGVHVVTARAWLKEWRDNA